MQLLLRTTSGRPDNLGLDESSVFKELLLEEWLEADRELFELQRSEGVDSRLNECDIFIRIYIALAASRIMGKDDQSL